MEPQDPDFRENYRRRLVIEFERFEEIDPTHIKMMLAAFDIKDISFSYLRNLIDTTPFFRDLLNWEPLIAQVEAIAKPETIRFGPVDSVLTRSDLDDLRDRARDPSKLYAPVRFFAFDFTVEEGVVFDQANLSVSPGQVTSGVGPPVRRLIAEALPAVLPPSAPSAAEIRKLEQKHLLSPPEGIGARDVWKRPGGKGYDVQFVDIEYGWELTHPDLPAIEHAYEGVASHDADKAAYKGQRKHGTGMLGIIAAEHNDRDTYGIAPDAKGQVLSQLRDVNLVNLAGAINLACAKLLGPGDVLLIEAQLEDDNGDLLPVEFDEEVQSAIEFGTTLGVIIIEPAGNGRGDLDASTIDFPPDGVDSGAILVGAGDSTVREQSGHDARWTGAKGSGTNFGSRVDCFAWGDQLRSLTNEFAYQTKKPFQYDAAYTGGTSAASAVIAGAAIVVQGIYKASFPGSVIWPEKMRELLSKPALGTSGVDGSGNDLQIGVMPDLTRVAAQLTKYDPPDKIPLGKFPGLNRALGGSSEVDGTHIPRLATLASLSLILIATTVGINRLVSPKRGNSIRRLIGVARRRMSALRSSTASGE